MHVKKGDTVKILSGKEKGKTGKVLSILQDQGRVVVEKVNFVKKHQRPDGKGKGGIVQKEGSIHLSNVLVLCGKCEKEIRVGHKKLENGKKVRVCRKCGEILDE